MKYVCTVEVNLPKGKTAALWADAEQFDKWQDGFTSIELLSGTAGVEGAKSRILFHDGKK